MRGFFSLELWRGFKIAELTEVMRQQGDSDFISLLNKIRVGAVVNEVEKLLKSRFVAKNDLFCPKHAVHMFAENCPVIDYNELMLNEIDGQTISLSAIDDIPHEVQLSDKQLETIRARKIGDTGNLASVLKLKIGAQVMLTCNINIEDRLVNGLVGKVMRIGHERNTVKGIYVKFDDQNVGLATMQSDIIGRQQHLVPIQKCEVSFPIKNNKPNPSIKRTQFPLVLSWACTVHKVQGLSLKEGVISFDLQRQKSFNQGQMYVALSRIFKFDNMYLIGKYHRNAIKVNQNAKQEYERLHNESMLTPLLLPQVTSDSLTITLLNTRSLRKHSDDILNDIALVNNDVLCLTETQLHLNEDTSEITSKFQNSFRMYFNNNRDKYRSIAFGYSSNMALCSSSDCGSKSVLALKKPAFLGELVKIDLLYRSPNVLPNLFLENLTFWIDEEKADILLGDFNLDALCYDSCNPLQQRLENYKLLVSEPTHMDGGLLDHVYIARSFSTNKLLATVIKNVYFSDHDAVKLQIKCKRLDNMDENIDFTIV